MNNPQKGTRSTRIGRIKATELIKASKGRFFTVTVATKDDPMRVMNCRLSVQKDLKPSPKRQKANIEEIGMITVYDMTKKEYRTVNLQTISALKINKKSYKVL